MEKMLRPALTLSLLLAACGPTALPGTPVSGLTDSGPGSLREVLAGAKDGDTLRFTTTGTVTLASPIVVDKDVTLVLDGVVLDGSGSARALEVTPDAAVTVQGGTLTGGSGGLIPLRLTRQERLTAQATSQATYGGVVLTAGTLTLSGTLVTGGKANNGGGIAVLSGGTLTLTDDAKVTGNDASPPDPDLENEVTGTGGGIFNMGTLVIDGGHVDANTSRFTAGGIRNTASGTITLKSGSVNNNAATLPYAQATGGSAGGGIFTTGTVDIQGGSISHNTVTHFGGGVAAQARCLDATCANISYPTFTMSGGTVEGNTTTGSADNGGGGLWLNAQATIAGGVIQGNSSMFGGGVNTRGALAVTGGSIQNNAASTSGGGISSHIPQNSPFRLTFGGGASVKGNTAGTTGGGLNLSSFTQADITGGTITGNSTGGQTDGGGGVRVLQSAVLNLSGGEISGNTSTRTGAGLTVSGQVNMTGGSIMGNTATDSDASAGGVRLYAGSSMTASGGVISNNKASFAAGVYIGGPTQTAGAAKFTLSGATVSGNTVTSPNSDAGGFFNGGILTITSGTVTQNVATRSGGGVYNARQATFNQTGGSVTGNTPDNIKNN